MGQPNATPERKRQASPVQANARRARKRERVEEVGPFTPAENVIAHLGGRRAETNGGGRNQREREREELTGLVYW
jgi:hypothetical protein